ncbi:hypothetical protein GCM10010521_73400 [Streptomyces rameus]|uniref:Uncharacterized protein n=1 Tax=Streptomyces rameus TaxID=68261 RepID=A0ABN3V913_9ACTN
MITSGCTPESDHHAPSDPRDHYTHSAGITTHIAPVGPSSCAKAVTVIATWCGSPALTAQFRVKGADASGEGGGGDGAHG